MVKGGEDRLGGEGEQGGRPSQVGLKSLSPVFVLLREFNRVFYSLQAVKKYYLFYYAVL